MTTPFRDLKHKGDPVKIAAHKAAMEAELTASTGDRSRSQTEEEPAAEVYEWTVLKRAYGTDEEEAAGEIRWEQVGIIGSDSNYFLYSEDTARIGALGGVGEYLCVCGNRAVRMTLVAETVYRRAAEPSDDALAGKMLRDGSVTP